MLKSLFLAAAIALIASPALADPGKNESGKGSFEVWDDREDGYRDRRERDSRGRSARNIPRGHYPAPGECRVWFYDRPAGHQPPPTSCLQAQRYADRYGGHVIWASERH